MLWKCNVCGMIKEGAEAPEKCPKCGAPKDKFTEMPKEAADKVCAADRTNDILMHIDKCAAKIIKLAEEGTVIGLDPGCLASFKNSKNLAWDIKQMVKAEIAIHVAKEKF